jgi:Transposase DDE domain
MELDLDTFLTALYTAVDGLYAARLAPVMAHRPGPKPVLSDSEVLTLAVCAAWGAWDSERAFYRFARRRLRPLFPRLVSYPEFNRRRRSLYPALAAVQRGVAQRLGADLQRERLLDTVPVPVMVLKRHDDGGLAFDGAAEVAWCQAKRQFYYGLELVLALPLDGVIVRYDLVPAATADRAAAHTVWEPGCRYWADKGFFGEARQREWREIDGVDVRATPPRGARARWPRELRRRVARLRQLIEVVNSQLVGQFRLTRHLAKTLVGLVARVQAKLTAHTVGVYLNVLLGRPALALKDLVV